MTYLFDPITFRSVTLKNRIGISPMCQYASENGFPTDWHLVHLGARAVGGAGLIIQEATAVMPEGRITPDDAGLWQDAHIEAYARINRFIKQYGAVPGIQLAHAGRKGSTANVWRVVGKRGVDVPLENHQGGWDLAAPSAIPFREGAKTPHAMTLDEIRDVQAQFQAATRRALVAGFEWVELHAAHGYLASSFLSPLSNQRTDAYGGVFENRIRFVMETVRAMRTVWPDHLPLSVRLSCTDWVEDGWTLEDSIALSRLLKDEGVDVIDCSSGFNVPSARVPFAPGFQVPLAEGIRRQAGIATAAVGVITDVHQANEIIQQGRADLVLLARESIRDPYWPYHAAQALNAASVATLPFQYTYAI